MAISITDIKKVLILGSGTLGLRIGLQAALSGFEVIIYDINESVFESAKKTQASILTWLISKEVITTEESDEALKKISFTIDAVSAAKDADFVSESVIEDLGIKKKVWSQFSTLCPAHAIFTTNTSYLMPSQFAAETGRPERFCAFHFHDVFTANVVDIMPHPTTDQWVSDLLMEMGTKLKQTPVFVKKESPGYIFNAMLVALIGAAGALVTYDVASIEDVDRSWIGNFKMDIGPFGILDNIGLETAWHVTKNLPDAKSQKFAALLKTYVDAGKLGVKTGEGFYKYPNPTFQDKNFVQKD
ncbi:MAG: 3-hydroxyacyl-CoA dehydrogenase [Bacteroidota bacterium]|nr:3-hydroxyacyl-CoA dehydrogenase [Bacteroidota bacterium]